jgi:hypothetical protein
MTDYICHFR